MIGGTPAVTLAERIRPQLGKLGLTTQQTAVAHRILDLADTPDWELTPSVYGITIRRTTVHQTPDYQRTGRPGDWDQDTYDKHVFITIGSRGVLLGVSAAPWVQRRDSDISLKKTLAILDDPDRAFRPGR
jgi:hypothetical protein